MPSGTGGQIAITRSDSLYLSVQSVNNWTDFVSESIEHTLTELEEGSITGNKDTPPSHKGIDSGAGDIVIEPDPNALGHFMRGVFGQSSGSLLTAAGSTGANSTSFAGMPVVQHRFLPIQTAFNDRNFLPPYTTMVFKDLGSAWFYQGTMFNAIEFNIQAAQLVKATVSMMARSVERYARTSSIAALTSKGSKKFLWDMASIQTGPGVNSLAANSNFESIVAKLNVPLEGVVLLDGTKKYAEYQVNEFRRLTVNGTLSFRSQDEYDAFVAYENRFLRINLRNTNSSQVLGNPASPYYHELQIDIPQFKFLTWSTPIGGPNRLVTSFTGKAERDVTSAYMVEALLTNVTSAY